MGSSLHFHGGRPGARDLHPAARRLTSVPGEVGSRHPRESLDARLDRRVSERCRRFRLPDYPSLPFPVPAVAGVSLRSTVGSHPTLSALDERGKELCVGDAPQLLIVIGHRQDLTQCSNAIGRIPRPPSSSERTASTARRHIVDHGLSNHQSQSTCEGGVGHPSNAPRRSVTA